MHNGGGVVAIGVGVTVMTTVAGVDVVGGTVATTVMMEMTTETTTALPIRQRWVCRPRK